VGIGTDRSTGDALGPLVGTSVASHNLAGVRVFGTLDAPIHAANLEHMVRTIEAEGRRPFVVAIDASLGKEEHVGWISACHGPLRPGLGVQKHLPAIGDVAVSGVVNVGGFLEFFVLQNTRLGLVVAMARVIASGVVCALGQSALPLDEIANGASPAGGP